MHEQAQTSAVSPTLGRRAFLRRAGGGVVVLSLGAIVGSALRPRVVQAQGAVGGGATGPQSAASNVEMTADSYKLVRREPKPNATPQMDEKQLEEFERTLACPCPCTLDIFTCRTTDFTCGISPAVHRDLQALVAGGYSADEIMSAMTGTYGDFILMAPRKQGFSLLAWSAPFAAVAVGAVAIGAVLRGWRRNAAAAAARAASARSQSDLPMPIDATAEEMARLQAALRDDR